MSRHFEKGNSLFVPTGHLSRRRGSFICPEWQSCTTTGSLTRVEHWILPRFLYRRTQPKLCTGPEEVKNDPVVSRNEKFVEFIRPNEKSTSISRPRRARRVKIRRLSVDFCAPAKSKWSEMTIESIEWIKRKRKEKRKEKIKKKGKIRKKRQRREGKGEKGDGKDVKNNKQETERSRERTEKTGGKIAKKRVKKGEATTLKQHEQHERHQQHQSNGIEDGEAHPWFLS